MEKGCIGPTTVLQEEWAQEHVRLARACDECELHVNAIEKGPEGTIAKVNAGFTTLEQQRLPLPHKQNGNTHIGLVT